MKRMFRLLAGFFCLAVPLFTGNSQVDTLTLLHLNDTHSMLAPTGPRSPSLQGTVGGIARAATVIGLTKMTEQNVLLLHAGDFSMGDLFYNVFFGAAELQIMNMLGFDAMAVGNHEFDLMPSTFKQALDSGFVGFPLLSANLVLEDPSVQPLKSYVRPFTIKDFGSLRVGIFGLLTPETNLLSQPAPALVDTGFVRVALAMVDTLKARHCNVIICLSHLGIVDDNRLAESVPGINVVVGGHDHYLFASPRVVTHGVGDPTWILQANSAYLDIGKLKLTVGGGHVGLLSYDIIPLDQSIPEEPTVAGVVTGLIEQIEGVYGPVYTQKIAFSVGFFKEVAESLMTPGYKDTPIGNLVSDAFREFTGTQIAIEVGGSTAQPLYPGPIVAADAFRVVGYGFNTDNGLGYHLATFTMVGADLLAGLEFGLSTIDTRDEFLIQASGLKYAYSATRPPFARLIEARVGNSPLDPAATYTITANEFVPMFLGSMGIPFGDLHVFRGDTTEFQVLTKYISALDTIRPKIEGRIVSELVESVNPSPETLPRDFNLDQNYPNPFNPSTSIRFDLPVVSRMTLKVYNLLGQEVATLVDGVRNAGSQTVVWNAGGSPSGVYFCRLSAVANEGNRTFAVVKRLVLVK